MHYIIMSDNHGDEAVLKDIIQHYPQAKGRIIHCGDSQMSADLSIWDGVVKVRGNCDYEGAFPMEEQVQMGAHRAFVAHGHYFSVNSGVERIAQVAKQHGATIVCYGHTHQLSCIESNGVICINPGSVSYPRGRYAHLPTYAILKVDEKSITVHYMTTTHQEIDDLRFEFTIE